LVVTAGFAATESDVASMHKGEFNYTLDDGKKSQIARTSEERDVPFALLSRHYLPVSEARWFHKGVGERKNAVSLGTRQDPGTTPSNSWLHETF
jgi:hypothetical protein